MIQHAYMGPWYVPYGQCECHVLQSVCAFKEIALQNIVGCKKHNILVPYLCLMNVVGMLFSSSNATKPVSLWAHG